MNINVDVSELTLRTERLLLRPWRMEDLQDFFAYASVDGVGQPAGWLPHRSPEESREILSMFIREKRALALEHGGRAIGSISVDPYDEALFPEFEEQRVAELGYQLSREHWGRGLMPEAVMAVCNYLFESRLVDKIICAHFIENGRSRRVLEKCGFRFYRPVRLETRYGEVKDSWAWLLTGA